MKRLLLLTLIVFAMMLWSSAIAVQSDTDPNTCFESGTCVTEADWKCGWSQARNLAGMNGLEGCDPPAEGEAPTTSSGSPPTTESGDTDAASYWTDDDPNNDPNTCFESGTCVTEADWKCGWSQARNLAGMNGLEGCDPPAGDSESAQQQQQPQQQQPQQQQPQATPTLWSLVWPDPTPDGTTCRKRKGDIVYDDEGYPLYISAPTIVCD